MGNTKLDWLKNEKILPSKSIRHKDENAKMVVSNQFDIGSKTQNCVIKTILRIWGKREIPAIQNQSFKLDNNLL